MKSVILLVIFLIQISFIYASCSDNQIDINFASVGELDKLIGIGPAKATAIIEVRPFKSVDDLLKVNGIGEKTLQGIKSQGLACVEDDFNESDEKENNRTVEKKVEQKIIEDVKIKSEIKDESPQPEIIKLSPQNIKTVENKNYLNKNYTLYGLLGFGIFIALLFLVKRRKYKNEFE